MKRRSAMNDGLPRKDGLLMMLPKQANGETVVGGGNQKGLRTANQASCRWVSARQSLKSRNESNGYLLFGPSAPHTNKYQGPGF